jgi:L-aspartate oxidase
MNTIESDFLIIGSGVAGLSLAIKLSELGTVALVSKREFLEGSTLHAQGGIAAVMSPKDSFERHIQDTLKAGAGLCREAIVREVVEEAPARIRELIHWGMAFTKGASDEESIYELGLEGGHSRRRVLHAADYTGSEVAKTLLKKAQFCSRIQFYDYHIAVDLITTEKLKGEDSCHPDESRGPVHALDPGFHRDDGELVRCLGAYVLDIRTGQVRTFLGLRATFLATGGAGKVYLYTTNPDVCTGDGMAMAFRAGAVMANMEFVQFHPTCLYHPEAKSFLISEAVRGEGGILKLRDGKPFMEAYHPDKDLAPRDIVARAIDNELKKRGDSFVYLDIRPKGAKFIKERFPHIYEECLRFGIDMTKEMIPVVPAAHYFCGGVQTDDVGRTSLEGLWAIGEVACTGLHGANRLASNSLLEGLVFAHRAFQHIRAENSIPHPHPLPSRERVRPTAGRVEGEGWSVPPWNPGKARNSDEQVVISQNWNEIRQLMWNYVGIVRSNKRLDRAHRRIQILQQEIHEYYWDFLITPDLIELRNIATVAELVVRSAMMRKESRGLHFNLDHPKLDDRNGRHDTILQRSPSPQPSPEKGEGEIMPSPFPGEGGRRPGEGSLL